MNFSLKNVHIWPFLHKNRIKICTVRFFFVPLRQIAVSMQEKIVFFVLGLLLAMWVEAKPYTVVIDAGHGGKDAGAVGHSFKLQEKNLNLEISLRLASKLRTEYPEMNVVLTRSTDVFLPLQERADIVNKNNADLFICIHTNSAESRSAHGAETFILGTDRMEDNLDVAMRENAVMKLEADYQTAYQGFDPNSVDSYIMFELMQNQYMDQSLQFASIVQTHMVSDLKRGDRGVRQAAFWVLLKSACPSVLVELGFISNKEEEQYMASDKGKREMTETLFNSFRAYYDGISGRQAVLERSSDTPVPQDTIVPVAPVAPIVSESSNGSCYRVQLFASKNLLQEGDPLFKGLKGCIHTLRGKWYKYMTGDCLSKEQADLLCKDLDKKFPGCFVVESK